MNREPLRNPFDVLPAKLFNLFTTGGVSSLQRVYMTVLLRLYGLSEFARTPLNRETVIAEIADSLRREHAETDVAAVMMMEDLEPAHTRPRAQLDLHDYASFILRRILECGWVEREQNTDYSETITLPDYTFPLLEAFRTIEEQKPREFKGQLYTAHQLITASNKKDFSAALAVTQAYENVRQVVRGLSELNQNIRRYIERATRGRSVPDLLRMQFDDYSETLGPAYHALKTSDHISRYRRAITDQLQRWQRNDAWLEAAANELALQRRITPAQASDEISHEIAFILQQLESLDPMIEEIDRRHSQYLKTSLRQIRYQIVGVGTDFKAQLISLARMLSEADDVGEEIETRINEWLQIRPVRLSDVNSYYTLPQRRRLVAPTLVESPVLESKEMAILRSAVLRDVTQALTPEKMDGLVQRLMNGARELHVRDMPSELRNNLHMFTAVIAFGHHPGVRYGIEVVSGDPVRAGNFLTQPFRLVLEGGGENGENGANGANGER